MGIFTRPDSPWWWLWLETAPQGQQREKTAVRIGSTTSRRRDSRQLAVEVYHQRMHELAAHIHRLPTTRPAIRFEAYADTYARDVLVHHRGVDREQQLLKSLRAFFGGDLLAAIDLDRTRAYMAARRLTVSASTVNREIDVLKSMLRDAVPKYLEVSPIVGMKRLRTVKPTRRLLTAEEERKLLTVGDAQDRALLILGLDTLMRLGDLLDLRRTDRAGLWLHVRDPKSGEPYDVPLSLRAVQALDALTGDGEYYFAKFRTKARQRGRWSQAVRRRLAHLCKLVGVDYGRPKGGITFHWATRRTGATRLLVAKGVPVAVVQQLGNWKNPDVLLKIYTEVQRHDLLAAVGQPLPTAIVNAGKG